MSGGITGQQRGDLIGRPRPSQAVQQPGYAERVAEGDVGGGITGQQRGDLVVPRPPPQAVQQPGHAARVAEGDVGGGTRRSSAAACSSAPARRSLSSSRATAPGSSRGAWAAARLASAVACSCAPASPQAVQQAGHGARVVEGGVGGGAASQRGGLLLRARLPQPAQQPRPRRPGRRGGCGRRRGRPARWPAPARPPPAGCPAGSHGERVVEGDVGGGITASSAATCSCAPASRRLSSRQATAPGSSRGAWAAARSASAVACSCAPAAAGCPAAGHGAGLSRETWAAGSRPAARRPARARPPPAGCPAARPRRRVVEGGVGGGAVSQRGDLLVRARLPQAVQQPATAPGSSRETWAAGTASQRGDLLLRARLPQAVQQLGHGVRVVEGDVGGGAVGQRGDLLVRARLPQPVQQPGHARPGCRGRRGRRDHGSAAR